MSWENGISQACDDDCGNQHAIPEILAPNCSSGIDIGVFGD
jgi:hypothetical protein